MLKLFVNVRQQNYLFKFIYLATFIDKEIIIVAKELIVFIMIIEFMKIMQFDNETKFKKVLSVFLKKFDIRIINDRLKWFQSQNLIENVNKTVKIQLIKWMRTHNIDRWSQNLFEINLSRLNAWIHWLIIL